ncbi:MAG: AAA family ATPase [Gemmatimonadota bacterium]
MTAGQAGGNGRSAASLTPGVGPRREGAVLERGRGAPVRFERVELRYGCHSRLIELRAGDAPFVILGPNGAGKTTVMEGAVRALYGFNRHRPAERRIHQERRPWEGEGYTAAVELSGPFGRLRVERDFETDEVAVREVEEGAPLFQGQATPTGERSEAKEYRQLLERILGLADYEAYARTAFVGQGGLGTTRLSQDLLQLAAGGHRDVQEALEAIRATYHEITTEPIAPGAARRRRPGHVEKLRAGLEELEGRLAEARAARTRREPLVREREEARGRLVVLMEEIRRLEDAFQGLSEMEALGAQRQASLERIGRLEDARREVDEALARLELLEQGPDAASYPADFLERVAALADGLWPRRAALEARRTRESAALERATGRPSSAAWLATGAAALATAGLAAAVGAPRLLPVLLALLGLAAGGIALASRYWRQARRSRHRASLVEVEVELAEVEALIRERLAGIPEADTLDPHTLEDRRRECLRQREEARRVEAARTELRGAMDRARSALRGEDSGSAVPRSETLAHRARGLLQELDGVLAEERNERLAPLQLELRDISHTQFALPDAVRSDSRSVRAALEARRKEVGELRERLEEVGRRLAFERPEDGPVALESARERLRSRVAERERQAAAYRWAFELVTRAYLEFRQTDQERLLEEVSARLAAVTEGELGPVSTEAELEETKVASRGRLLPLDSPPLSYGEFHSVLLAVRLGMADFLTEYGVRVPLVLDDPFVHLDAERGRQLWALLDRIARERQVVILTQDGLLLEHLGVHPDLRLGPERQTA